MNKPAGDVRDPATALAGWRTAWDRIIFHKWALPISGMVTAAGAAILAGQVLAWRLDRAAPPALPEPPPPAVPASTAAIRISAGGFIPQAAPSEPVPVAASGSPSKTGLPVDLLGTIVASPKRTSKSLAIVQSTAGAREVEVLRVGEKWQGLELLEVERSRIWIRNLSTGAREYISSDQLAAAAANVTPKVKVRPAAGDPSNSEQVVLSRSQVNRAIDNNTNVIFSWVDVQPYAVGGQVEGFRLNSIKPRGKPFFEMLRFKEGDIVKRVNGVKMDSVDKAVGLWAALHGKDQVSFTVERQGIEREISLAFKE